MNSEQHGNWHSRAVFFARDATRALNFYTQELGFLLDWNYEHEGRPFVFQVSLNGFELIVNQAEAPTDSRPGHGRVFVGLDDEQTAQFQQHIEDSKIETEVTHWGEPTIVVRDLDGNELFFWLCDSERNKLRHQINSGD